MLTKEKDMTQSSSKPRVKNDVVGNEGLSELFQAYQDQQLEDFRTYCRNVIEQSAGKRTTKDKFIQVISSSRSKNDILTRVTNYLMAGQGLGV